jgi:hypothetical protein
VLRDLKGAPNGAADPDDRIAPFPDIAGGNRCRRSASDGDEPVIWFGCHICDIVSTKRRVVWRNSVVGCHIPDRADSEQVSLFQMEHPTTKCPRMAQIKKAPLFHLE